jgi:hypothetical protein
MWQPMALFAETIARDMMGCATDRNIATRQVIGHGFVANTDAMILVTDEMAKIDIIVRRGLWTGRNRRRYWMRFYHR